MISDLRLAPLYLPEYSRVPSRCRRCKLNSRLRALHPERSGRTGRTFLDVKVAQVWVKQSLRYLR